MGTSLMAVQFPDGAIKYGWFNDTGDKAYETLLDTPEEAKTWLDTHFGRYVTLGSTASEEIFDVVVCINYVGSCLAWKAKATYNRLIGPLDLDKLNEMSEVDPNQEVYLDPPEWGIQILGCMPTR